MQELKANELLFSFCIILSHEDRYKNLSPEEIRQQWDEGSDPDGFLKEVFYRSLSNAHGHCLPIRLIRFLPIEEALYCLFHRA